MSIGPRIAMVTCTFSIGARKTPRNSKRPRAVVGCFCMVSLLGMSSFPLAIAPKISNVSDVDLLPVIRQGCLRLVVAVKATQTPEKCRDPRRCGGDPDDEPWAGEDLFCQREVPFVSSIEEAGGLR